MIPTATLRLSCQLWMNEMMLTSQEIEEIAREMREDYKQAVADATEEGRQLDRISEEKARRKISTAEHESYYSLILNFFKRLFQS